MYDSGRMLSDPQACVTDCCGMGCMTMASELTSDFDEMGRLETWTQQRAVSAVGCPTAVASLVIAK